MSIIQVGDKGPEESHSFAALQDHPDRDKAIVIAAAHMGHQWLPAAGGHTGPANSLLLGRELCLFSEAKFRHKIMHGIPRHLLDHSISFFLSLSLRIWKCHLIILAPTTGHRKKAERGWGMLCHTEAGELHAWTIRNFEECRPEDMGTCSHTLHIHPSVLVMADAIRDSSSLSQSLGIYYLGPWRFPFQMGIDVMFKSVLSGHSVSGSYFAALLCPWKLRIWRVRTLTGSLNCHTKSTRR